MFLSLLLASPKMVVSGPAKAPSVDEVEASISKLVNSARQENGLGQVEEDPILKEIARQHSEEMATLNYFSHVSPVEEFRSLGQRMRLRHHFSLQFSENLHQTEGLAYAKLPADALQGWLDSPVHRKNMLNPAYNRVGTGVAFKGRLALVTQIFCHECVCIESFESEPENGGYKFAVKGKVVIGNKEGSCFFDSKRVVNWTLEPGGGFHAEGSVPRPGVVEVGQLVGVREWDIQVEIPVPTPKNLRGTK